MDLTQESFDRLLAWLHPDPEEAGRKYVQIRSNLIKRFASHHCLQPENLADITIDRVAMKLPQIIDTYVGDPERYFQRVAYFVLMESRAKAFIEEEIDDEFQIVDCTVDDDTEVIFGCLEKCMGTLTLQKRELIDGYYQGDKGVKIRRRKELASQLNVEQAVLRVTALRIRQNLKECITACMRAQGR